MSDTFDAGNPLAWPLRWSVIRGIDAASHAGHTAPAQSSINQSASGSGDNVVFLYTANNVVANHDNHAVVGGARDDTIGIGGNVVPFGGSGAMPFLRGAGSGALSGGTGPLGVSGGLSAATVFGGAGRTSADFGGTGSALVVMASGAEEYIGGSGNDVVVAGLGNDTVFAGSGSDVFTLGNQPGAPKDLIAGFNLGGDLLQMHGFAAAVPRQAVQTASVSGGHAILHLPDGTTVTLVGIANLTGSAIV